MKTMLAAFALVMLLLAAPASPASAMGCGPGCHISKSTITLDQPNPIAGQDVTFSYSAVADGPIMVYIRLICDQNGKTVMDVLQNEDAGVVPFTLGFSGAAKCVAYLENYYTGFGVMAKTNFGVGG